MNYAFTTVITKEDKWYVAECIELGVASQGKTIEKAQDNLREAVELYLEDQPKNRRPHFRREPLISTMYISHV